MLKAENIGYRIQEKVLIEKISLSFQPGILYGILGPNGSGKSTLLKTLTGIWKPSEGKVLWKGSDLLACARKEISRTISLVPQNPQVHFDFTVEDMVLMGRYPYGSQRNPHAMQLVEQVLHTVDAWHLRQRSILKISHGERKRVYIARALITESPILLLDEPTASLDVRHQLDIWHLLKKLVQQDKIIIVTNHDLTATERFCDEIAVLDKGRCLITGPCAKVLSPALLADVFGVAVTPTALQQQYDICR